MKNDEQEISVIDKLDKIQLDKIYQSYGFEVNNDYKNTGVYLYKKGRYFGADIIPLELKGEGCLEANGIKDDYSNAGYAATIKQFESITEVQAELFKSFFSYDLTRSRLKKKYEAFTTKQTKNLLGNKYEYIDTLYESFKTEHTEHKISLIDRIETIINDTNPRLIVIEAAAGYGKTCTAYELLSLITKKETLKTPIFTEISRNRGAKIFRYILLDEIDLEYPTLNSDVVIKEIKTGRIPLIIDGFDELLEKVNINSDASASFDDVETMLDTIGGLLEGQAKIILTTRKTAIFSGIEFDLWVQKWNNKFQTDRFLIKEPRIKDWIGLDKYKLVREKAVPIQHIANPVILSYLKNLNFSDFEIQLENPDLFVKEYFTKMLEREKERQNLILNVDQQYDIFKNVVKLMLEFDISSETKEFFKEIIKDQNYKLLDYTRTLYVGVNKPSVENLVDSLATHALLDRKGRDENQIGFINDFVFGIFIGDIICESEFEIINNNYSFYMIELAATAYKVQTAGKRLQLWEKVNLVSEKFQNLSLFTFDIILKEALSRDYNEISVYEFSIFNIDFTTHNINASVFLNCIIKECVFDTTKLIGVSFVNCVFIECKVSNNTFIDLSNEITTIKCKQKLCHILQFPDAQSHEETDEKFSPIEKKIFKALLNVTKEKTHHIVKLLRSFDKKDYKMIGNAVRSLEARGYIEIRDHHISYNINKLTEIKDVLSNSHGL